jgi:hypothetical protein
MEDNPERSYSFRVNVIKDGKGRASCDIAIRMRDLTWFVVARQYWPSGAPTPGQLELLQAAVADELQTHVLAICGVQGVLLAGESPEG